MIRALLIGASIATLLSTPMAASAQRRQESSYPRTRLTEKPFYVRNRERFSRERHREIERNVRRVQRETRDRDYDLEDRLDRDMDGGDD